jgi:hypothetical protein
MEELVARLNVTKVTLPIPRFCHVSSNNCNGFEKLENLYSMYHHLRRMPMDCVGRKVQSTRQTGTNNVHASGRVHEPRKILPAQHVQSKCSTVVEAASMISSKGRIHANEANTLKTRFMQDFADISAVKKRLAFRKKVAIQYSWDNLVLDELVMTYFANVMNCNITYLSATNTPSFEYLVVNVASDADTAVWYLDQDGNHHVWLYDKANVGLVKRVRVACAFEVCKRLLQEGSLSKLKVADMRALSECCDMENNDKLDKKTLAETLNAYATKIRNADT